MNAKLRAILLPILRNVRSGKAPSFRNRSAAEQAMFLLGKRSKKGKKASAARKSEKAAAGWTSVVAVREAVLRRACGRCEACILMGLPQIPEHLDHWLGGSGRRRPKQSVETCWMLCWRCHRNRTVNAPTAQHWNDAFRKHCENYGYPFVPHIVHEPLTRKAT